MSFIWVQVILFKTWTLRQTGRQTVNLNSPSANENLLKTIKHLFIRHAEEVQMKDHTGHRKKSDNSGPNSKTKEQPTNIQHDNLNTAKTKCKSAEHLREAPREKTLYVSVFSREDVIAVLLTWPESEIITRRKTGHAFRCGTTTYLNAMASRDENWFIKDSCGGSRLSSWRWSRELFRDLRRGHKNAWVRRGEMFELSHTKAAFRMIYSCTLYYAVCFTASYFFKSIQDKHCKPHM